MTNALQKLPTDTGVLLEDLCLALRRVGVNDSQLPDGQRVADAIRSVQQFHAALLARGADILPRLRQLSAETGWLMPELLADCLLFPAAQPYARESDGIRHTLRCQRCRRAEFPPGAQRFRFCAGCLREVAAALRAREPVSGVAVFRTYTPECRCEHADSETPLACEPYAEELAGVCERCISEELTRREPNPSAA